ncbi:MAG TPA: serine hydrolase [Gemmatimonadales bacterium]|nr:serine hydrolase [Gemmatimonadales bacterium]
MRILSCSCLLLTLLATAPATRAGAQSRAAARASDGLAALDAGITARIAQDSVREPLAVGLVLLDPVSGLALLHDADRRMHAASTMKLPVLIELARRVNAGDEGWDDSLLVRNRFASIVDGSPYTLDRADDTDSTLYALEGRRVSRRRLAELMITRSSNLATNLLIGELDPKRVQATARVLGADSIEIRRGVEDGKAYAAGLNNTTTARDLALLLDAVARGAAAPPAGTTEILRILGAQEINDRIPAGLPPGTRVAHKTGEITGISHDAALVYPPDGRPYVLVVLTRGYADGTCAARAIADLSRLAWSAVLEARATTTTTSLR